HHGNYLPSQRPHRHRPPENPPLPPPPSPERPGPWALTGNAPPPEPTRRFSDPAGVYRRSSDAGSRCYAHKPNRCSAQGRPRRPQLSTTLDPPSPSTFPPSLML